MPVPWVNRSKASGLTIQHERQCLSGLMSCARLPAVVTPGYALSPVRAIPPLQRLPKLIQSRKGRVKLRS